MDTKGLFRLSAAIVTCGLFGLAISQAAAERGHDRGRPDRAYDEVVQDFSKAELEQGRQTFRFDTFGDEAWWGDELQLHQAIQGAAHGGVGPGVSPATALAVGLKVDVDALPVELQEKLKHGQVDLNDPATTLALLKLNSVVGVTGRFKEDGSLKSMGIQCALCHSTVDNSLAPGVGHRLDGWANRDLNVGAIVALAPHLDAIANLLGVDVPTVRTVLNSWGPGKFDAELILDGKAFRPDGKSAATLIPPAFGLQGVNLHTWTGWGSIPHWNAFVAVLEMHGKGTFFDPRLDDAVQFPVAARARFGHVTSEPDLVSAKLPALQYYQLSLPAPAPPAGSFDVAAAERGDALFSGKAKCASCHTDGLGSEPGWNMHKGSAIGIDDFQADRAPDHAYRTAPLKGLWTHMKGGFFHDGRFATLADVIDHYDGFFNLGLSASEKSDVAEYLKSLSDDVAPSVHRANSLNAGIDAETASIESPAPSGGLSVWPLPATPGRRVEIAFLSPSRTGTQVPADLTVGIYDVAGRRVAQLGSGAIPAERGMVTVAWDGKEASGTAVNAGVYFVRATAPSLGYHSERRIVVR
jgi:mono/diheme cytochrome c family protein